MLSSIHYHFTVKELESIPIFLSFIKKSKMIEIKIKYLLFKSRTKFTEFEITEISSDLKLK